MHPSRPPVVTVVGGGLAGLIAAVECAEAGAARPPAGGPRPPGRPGHLDRPAPSWPTSAPRALHGHRTVGLAAPPRPARPRPHAPQPADRPAVAGERPAGAAAGAAAAPAAGRGRRAGRPRPARLAHRRWGPDTAAAVAGLAGPLTFDHDPGRLSAAFVVERIQRILLSPDPRPATWRAGGRRWWLGWPTIARAAGVRVETESPVAAGDLADLAGARPGGRGRRAGRRPAPPRRGGDDRPVGCRHGAAPGRVARRRPGRGPPRPLPDRRPRRGDLLDPAHRGRRGPGARGARARAAQRGHGAGRVRWRTAWAGSRRCSTPRRPRGASGSAGAGARASARRPAPSTCPVPPGATVPRSSGATGCGWRVTGWRRRATWPR